MFKLTRSYTAAVGPGGVARDQADHGTVVDGVSCVSIQVSAECSCKVQTKGSGSEQRASVLSVSFFLCTIFQLHSALAARRF